MSKIEAKIVEDSKNEFGNRITTMVVTFPRIILAEFNTHRMFSRNSASSRAIPFAKMVESVKTNPFIPIAWQKDHKGMQGTEYFTDQYDINALISDHLEARDHAIIAAYRQATTGLTKQICNRYLEPFMWHTVIVTATEWENFFALRCPRYEVKVNEISGQSQYSIFRSKNQALEYSIDPLPEAEDVIGWLKFNKGQAEIHMMALAEAMWDAMNESTPKLLKSDEWHIPFGDNVNINNLTGVNIDSFIKQAKIKIATARCARISYTVVGEEDKKDNYENDIKLHDKLKESGHMSPFEHCAKAMDTNLSSGNFTGGWIQYRKMIPNENII